MPGDHKRKARPIAPATVTVGPDSITAVVLDVLGKNEATVGGRKNSASGARFLSAATKKYRESIRLGRVAAATVDTFEMSAEQMVQYYAGLQAASGAWRLEVVGVWPTQNHDVGFVAPRGDADAAIPQALDALQHAGILDDDARVVEVRAWNLYRKGVRATVMRLVRMATDATARDVDGRIYLVPMLAERDAAIAHLLPLVPQSPEPPAKPARKRKAKSS